MTTAVFLPGILLPATIRYAPLLAALGADFDAATKELEIYAADRPPLGYTVQTEVDGLQRFAEERGLDRFHLYGHSAGGAVALAYIALHPQRVASLALDEPATDFSDADLALIGDDGRHLDAIDPAVFMRSLVRPEVELPELPAPPTPEVALEMAKRPVGIATFRHSLRQGPGNAELRAYASPVYFSYGSLSNARWEAMAERLASVFADYEAERYEGLHHLNTSHTAEPERVAEALLRLWARAG